MHQAQCEKVRLLYAAYHRAKAHQGKYTGLLYRVVSDQGHIGFRALMDFAEYYAKKENYSAIRIDSYTGNKKALRFYEKRGYKKRGECFFAGRDMPFYCYELIF